MKNFKYLIVSVLAGVMAMSGCAASASSISEAPSRALAAESVSEKAPEASEKKEEEKNHEFDEIVFFGIDDKTDGRKETSADAIKLVTLDHDDSKIRVVSPSHELLTVTEDGKTTQLGDIYEYGKEESELEAVNRTFDLDFEKYVSFDYDAIRVLVDYYGGVDIDLTQEEIDQTNHPLHINGKAGTYTLDGKQAVAYVRIVKIDSDEDRSDRIGKVAEKLAEKLKDSNAADLTMAVTKIFPYIRTNLSISEIVDLLSDAIEFKNGKIASNYTPKTADETDNGIFVDDYAKLAEEVHEKLYDGHREYKKSADFEAFEMSLKEALKEA